LRHGLGCGGAGAGEEDGHERETRKQGRFHVFEAPVVAAALHRFGAGGFGSGAGCPSLRQSGLYLAVERFEELGAVLEGELCPRGELAHEFGDLFDGVIPGLRPGLILSRPSGPLGSGSSWSSWAAPHAREVGL
jgi:hypothetical protein